MGAAALPCTAGMDNKPKIGFAGLGLMGRPMATRVQAVGFPLVIWNRTMEKAAAITSDDRCIAASPAELTVRSDVVMLCLSDTAAVEEVVFAREGVYSDGRPDKVLVDFSTIDPVQTREFAERLYRSSGMRWVDAPVSGGTPGAETGSLMVMAGGSEEDIARVSPVLGCLARRITRMGPTGAGQLTKVCNQVIVGSTIAAICEALSIGRASGLDVARLPDCLAGGFADSTVLQYHARRMIAGDLAGRGSAISMLKEMQIACSSARDTHTAVPVTALTTELYQLLVMQGHGGLDQIGLMRLYDKPGTSRTGGYNEGQVLR